MWIVIGGLALIGLGLVVGALAFTAIDAAVNRWPERAPRPYECFICRVTYTDARQLEWHNQSHHPQTYDQPRGSK